MNNLFGLPDGVMDAIIMSAINQSVQSSKKGGVTPETPKKGVTPTEGAEAAKKIYDSYIAAGFSNDQAFELLKLVLSK